MYLTTYNVNKKNSLGCKIGNYLFQLDRAYKFFERKESEKWLFDMKELLSHNGGLEEVKKLKEMIEDTLLAPDGQKNLLLKGILHSVDDVKIIAPILNPEKIICLGLNYKDHCKEQNKPLPKSPILFSKFLTAIIGPDDNIVKPKITEKLDFEGELAFIMGKGGRHIPVKNAIDYIAGYTIFNDITARDIQFSDRQWLRGKTFDTFAPMGPYLVTRDEIKDPHNLIIKVKVNGKVMQNSNTNNMIHRIPSLVSFISQVVTLSPGDVVATGTPAGVGVFRKPPIFLQAEDEVSVEIEKLGILRNKVFDEK